MRCQAQGQEGRESCKEKTENIDLPGEGIPFWKELNVRKVPGLKFKSVVLLCRDNRGDTAKHLPLQ